MITMTSHQTRMMICATILNLAVTTLAAKTSHDIAISVSGGAIVFGHNPKDGQNGTVLAADTDTVKWKCQKATCSSILIHFDVSPCQEGADIQSTGDPAVATCTLTCNCLLQAYKYKITVNSMISQDPHVIVDNQVLLKPKPKKNR